jgi:molybdopterin synthase catalytic subunit
MMPFMTLLWLLDPEPSRSAADREFSAQEPIGQIRRRLKNEGRLRTAFLVFAIGSLDTVRAHSRGRDVIALEYEAYEEMAEEVMAEIAEELRTRYDLCKVGISHRLGRVEVGETSVAIAVSAPLGRTRSPPAPMRSRH